VPARRVRRVLPPIGRAVHDRVAGEDIVLPPHDQNPQEREGAAGTGQVGVMRECRHRQCQRGEGARDGPDKEIYPEMRERVLHGPHQRIWYLVTVP
jgi:hypothetical protein